MNVAIANIFHEQAGLCAQSAEPPPDVQTVTYSILGSSKTLFMEINHSLPLIQVGQLSVAGERMCTKYWLSA